MTRIRSRGVQCWMLHVPARCLHPEMRRGGAQLHERVVAGGALWAEPTLPAAAPTAMRRQHEAGEGTS